MKSKEEIREEIYRKGYLNELKRRKAKKKQRRVNHEAYLKFKRKLNDDFSYANVFKTFLPPNAAYIFECVDSDFYIEKLLENVPEKWWQFQSASKLFNY